MTDRDKQFAQRAREAYRGSGELEQSTLDRLSAIRKEALDQFSSRQDKQFSSWLLPGGAVAFATVAVIAVSLYLHQPWEKIPGTALDDIELLTSADKIELYEELEFYSWLADEKDRT